MFFLKKTKEKFKGEKGFSLAEAIIASAISLFVILGITAFFSTIFSMSVANSARIQAAFLAEEGLEAVRILRDAGWDENIETQALDVPFYLDFEGSSWTATTSNIYVDGLFQREVVLSAVNRDSNFDIVESGGNSDPDSRKITVSISWSLGNSTTTKSVSTYLTNVFNN